MQFRRDGSGGDRPRNQENRAGNSHPMPGDKNKSEDFVVLSLDEIRRRKSECMQTAAEGKGRHSAALKDQTRDAGTTPEDSNISSGGGPKSRERQIPFNMSPNSPHNDRNVTDLSLKKSPQATAEAVDDPDYEMSEDGNTTEESLSYGGNSASHENDGGNGKWQDPSQKVEGDAPETFKKFRRQGGNEVALGRNGEDRDENRATPREGYHRIDTPNHGSWDYNQQSRQAAPHDVQAISPIKHPQEDSPNQNDTKNPWKIQEQPPSWCTAQSAQSTSPEPPSNQNEEEEHTPARPGKTYGNIYSDSQRTMKRNERDRKGHYDDGGYYDGPARPNMRDDNAKRNELSQNAEEYRNDYDDRQGFNQVHGNSYRYNQYDRRLNNSSYQDRDRDRYQHGGGWNNRQCGGNRSDSNRQDFSTLDTRDQSKFPAVPQHQQEVQDSGFLKSDYDDDRAKPASRMGYGRRDLRFSHQGFTQNRFSQRGAVKGSPHTLPTGDDMAPKSGLGSRYGDRLYDTGFQRGGPHRRGNYFGGNKDEYPYYSHQDTREDSRGDIRRPHKSAHPMDHQDDAEGEQGPKRGRQMDPPCFHTRPGRPPKRSRTCTPPHSPSRSGDGHDEAVSRNRGAPISADLPEYRARDDESYQKSVDYSDFYSLERAIMLEPLPSLCASFFDSIDRGTEPPFECCKKVLIASSSREEVVIMRKIFSYMQHTFRDRMRIEDYMAAAQCYALIRDSQNVRSMRDNANKLGLIFSPISWVQLLRYVCTVKKSTPDIIRIVVEEVIRGQPTQKLVASVDFILQQCLEYSLTDECMQIIHKFRKISTELEFSFDSRTLTDLVEHLMNLCDFKSAYQAIQFSYTCKQNVAIKTALKFVSECATRQRYCHLAKQAYLILRRYDRFTYRDVDQLQDIIENLAKARLMPESIVVLQDIVSSSLPVNSPRVLVTLLTTITDEADCEEAIGTFKQLLLQKLLVPRHNARLYEELTRFFFKHGTPENMMWFRDYVCDMCITATPIMRRFLFNSEGALLSNNDLSGAQTSEHRPQDIYHNTPVNSAPPTD